MYDISDTLKLTEEEIRQQIIIIQNGLPAEAEIAKEKIVRQFIKFIYKFTYGIKLPKGYELDDLVSCGLMGLLKAAEKFDLTKTYKKESGEECHIKFFSFASNVLKNDIFMELRNARKINDKEIFSLNDKLIDKDGKAFEKQDIFPDEKPNCMEQFIKESDSEVELIALKKAINNLPPKQKAVISYMYFSDEEKKLSNTCVGETLNISRSYISRIKSQAIKNIFESMKEGEDSEQ